MAEPDHTVLGEVVVSHQDRAVVRVGDVFIKVDANGDRVEREVAALRGVSIAGPEVLWHRRGDVHLLALTALTGTPLGLLGQPSPHPSDAWRAAGRVARQLHGDPVPQGLAIASRYQLEDIDELESWVLSRGVAPPAVVEDHARRARAARDAATASRTSSLVHGDLQPAHVFVTGDQQIAGVIDWGDAGIGDAHYDLAVLTVGHGEHLQAVIEGYVGEIDVERIHGYWSWRRLSSVRWMTEHGLDASGDIAVLDRGS